ncbi:DEAD/DEAH box helicase family protein [Streptomyces filamentosus]|uniref:DEAD/DEAH box helicase family protein n=1 Tax=Streptomyces filamentosus TaxID=67294 RepID=UPI0036E8C410
MRVLRAHQREAVDAVVRALGLPGAGERGVRTQVVMATGSGKTLVAARSAETLGAGRVLVLVPSLDLLIQTEAAWREAGRTGPMIGVSSLRGEDVSFPSTTDVDELVGWVGSLERVTVFATYASLGLGTLERAHRAGLAGWDLIVVDEAHRTSGRVGKPWAVVHDNMRIPSLRRLYMTATPRLWQLDEGAGQGAPGELVASMEDDPDGPFGARCFTLTLSEAIDRGICAPYQVVCVDITDTRLQAAQLLGAEGRSEEVRGARLAALQTALLKASAEEGFRRTLVFHHQVREAEAFAAGLPGVAARLHAAEPGLYPGAVWADWLCGEHKPGRRRRVLGEFADGIASDGTVVEKGFLGSVRVLGEGVDTRECDSVYWADVRGSMPDLVQAVGRALRMHPGEGKVASLVVPVLLGPGETPDNMLTSRAFGGLAKLLEALRAHDARVVEQLLPAPTGPP